MESVQSLVDTVGELPTLPDVVAKVNGLVQDPATSAADINGVISVDVSLSARILKIVNSPYYGFHRRITTITYAVVILGFNAVRNLALSAFVFDVFRRSGRSPLDLPRFWQHSIGSAVAAAATGRLVARQTGREVDPKIGEDAFMCGLLHDIGKVLMSQYLKDDLAKVMAEVERADCLFLEAEAETLPYTHAGAGAALLEHWELPEAICAAVRAHHAPAEGEVPGRERLLAAITHVSDILARALLIGSGGDRRMPKLLDAYRNELGLSWDEVGSLMDQVQAEMKRAAVFFSLD
jgi:putative nucleotidyltransferase with HDIG domain